MRKTLRAADGLPDRLKCVPIAAYSWLTAWLRGARTCSTSGSESEVSLIRDQQLLQQIGTGGLCFDVDNEAAIDKGGTFDCHWATVPPDH
jgi:hypothetical protein